MVVLDSGLLDPNQHLSLKDWIKQSKTDPFRAGVMVYLHKTGRQLCPVAALLSYLVVRGKDDGPLFRLRGGDPLTRPCLVSLLREAPSQAGLDPEKYAGHSSWIGAATTAAALGVPVDLIKTLGIDGGVRHINCTFGSRTHSCNFSCRSSGLNSS